MVEPSLAGVWEKHQRACAHLESLESAIDGFIEGDIPAIEVSDPQLDPEGWHVVYALVNREPGPDLGVILGDVVHNVRSGLDQLVWQLVLLNDETPRDGPDGNCWPIVYSKSGWQKAKHTSLRGVASEHRAEIGNGQPRTAGDRSKDTRPASLQELSNVDKHQIVHSMAVVMRDPVTPVGFRVTSGPGEIVEQQFRAGQPLDHQAPILRARVEGASDETKVEMQGNVSVDVAFGEGGFSLATIKGICQWFEVAIETFEPDFLPAAGPTASHA